MYHISISPSSCMNRHELDLLVSLGHTRRKGVLGHTLNTLQRVITKKIL